MTTKTSTKKSRRWIIIAAALASVVAYCAPPGTFLPIGFDYTGTVRDKDTNEPIEGAYVVGMYFVSKSNMAASVFQCKKTIGTYSDKNGVYHLPIEKLDNLNPHFVAVIKPGYFDDQQVFPIGKKRFALTKEAFSNLDVFLRKQDPAKPEFIYGNSEVGCIFAEKREDVAASAKFVEIELSEVERWGGETWRIRDLKERLSHLSPISTKAK